MNFETIPFKVFLSVTPNPGVLSMLDGGLTFFIGTGAVLLGLIALEKMGITLNETMIRALGVMSLIAAALWFMFKNPLFRSMVMGF